MLEDMPEVFVIKSVSEKAASKVYIDRGGAGARRLYFGGANWACLGSRKDPVPQCYYCLLLFEMRRCRVYVL